MKLSERIRRRLRNALRARCHWQNLNEKGREEVRGSIIRHGRAWFHRKRSEEAERTGKGRGMRDLAVEWSVWTNRWALQLSVGSGDNDDDVGLWLACGLFSLHVTFEAGLPRRLKDRIQFGSAANAAVVDAVRRASWRDRRAFGSGVPLGDVLSFMADEDGGYNPSAWQERMAVALRLVREGVLVVRGGDERNPVLDTAFDPVYGYWARHVGVRIFDKAVWLECWAPDDSWSSTEPWWMRGTFHYVDFLLGRLVRSRRELERARAVVPMPEKAYPATVVLSEVTVKRPRWPFAEKIVRAEITPDEPIPMPGKGTESYNCGPDASYSLTTTARTVAEAVAAMSASVMKDRERRGGSVEVMS